MKKIKHLIILFVFTAISSFSQAQIFDFWNNKVVKISMKGADDITKADFIGRQMEKSQLAVFSYVDPTSGTGYFIINNFSKVQELKQQINNTKGYSFVGYEEITFNKALFLEMYMKRGGFENSQFSKNKPKEISMGTNEDLTNILFSKAFDIWNSFYAKTIDEKSNDLPEHYPVFVNTGNPEYDSSKYEQAKQDWLKNYPEETKYSTGVPYQVDKAKKDINNNKN